ncbi:MAG TPA: hypothetical protein VFH58_11605 [Acidimicrobiales bacterium]|nr:hypothetical protein [Acidimicrobiales bacterium]
MTTTSTPATPVPPSSQAPRAGTSRRRYAGPWTGPKRSYDLVKEFVIALVVVGLLSVVLALILSSPDDKGVTLQQWARQNPSDFVTTAVTELDGTSTSAGYGAPYNNGGGEQSIFFIHLQKWIGVHIPVDPAQDFVVAPLSTVSNNPDLRAALKQWTSASSDQQQKWASAYDDAIGKADGDPAKAAPGDYGPVPTMTSSLLTLAQTGALDSQLVNQGSGFYQDNYTKPLLFLADGGYLDDLAGAQHLHGDQWGMMNETGNYPGQAWLWLYTMWYQFNPFKDSGNADVLIWGMMMVLSLGLILVPFIPGLRSIPRYVPVHRAIWRDYYRDHPLPPTKGARRARE